MYFLAHIILFRMFSILVFRELVRMIEGRQHCRGRDSSEKALPVSETDRGWHGWSRRSHDCTEGQPGKQPRSWASGEFSSFGFLPVFLHPLLGIPSAGIWITRQWNVNPTAFILPQQQTLPGGGLIGNVGWGTIMGNSRSTFQPLRPQRELKWYFVTMQLIHTDLKKRVLERAGFCRKRSPVFLPKQAEKGSFGRRVALSPPLPQPAPPRAVWAERPGQGGAAWGPSPASRVSSLGLGVEGLGRFSSWRTSLRQNIPLSPPFFPLQC